MDGRQQQVIAKELHGIEHYHGPSRAERPFSGELAAWDDMPWNRNFAPMTAIEERRFARLAFEEPTPYCHHSSPVLPAMRTTNSSG
jgi:hypothetical protein